MELCLSRVRVMMLAIVVVVFYVVAVAGQDTGLSPLPPPGAVAGDGFTLPISGTLIVSSVLISLIAVLFN
ncbi:hypothetical protein BVRB_3g061030 [Beta vulgaris subsp. vulgaris]|nr:hypothetical protein BVRB_3g061030 [Beta vulgaris subsp. vulgaris]